VTDATILLMLSLLCRQPGLTLRLFCNDRTPSRKDVALDYVDCPGVEVPLDAWEVDEGVDVFLVSHPKVVASLPFPCPTVYGWRVTLGDLHIGASLLENGPITPTVANSRINVEPMLRLERKDVAG